MNDILKLIPEMKAGNALISALSVLPAYDENIRSQNEAVRLIALSDLYRVYIPSPMTTEIYSKLYLALLRSLQKKMTKTAVIQQNQNHRAIQQQEYTGIMGGSDSFTIIGNSGIGKSSAISRSLSLLQADGIIETQKPYAKIIPCVVVQCPFDSSVKGLLLEILRKVDEIIGSDYYKNALKIRVTTDMLIGSVSQVAINHIGLLVVDEIQNVVNSKHGKSLEQTFTLCPAESYIGDKKPIIEADPLKIAFAQYMVDAFNAPIDFEKDIPISAVLYHGMQNTQYIKSTGKTRYTKQLAEDINAYYTRLNICDIASMSQIQRVLLGGDRFDFSVICQIAFYLGMDIKTLTNPMLTAAQIEQEQSTHYMANRPAIDWAVYDAETAPILERVAKSIYDGTASETGRPKRVSEKVIYREMGFPGHRLENLPLCKAVFDKYSESYEENWARRIVWGYAKLKANNAPFYWSDLRTITGVKKKNIEKVIPHIRKYTNRKTAEAIINLVGGT